MTADQLRAAGFPAEADQLAAARRRADTWTFRAGDAPSDRAVALSLFGSARFDQLARAIGEREHGRGGGAA